MWWIDGGPTVTIILHVCHIKAPFLPPLTLIIDENLLFSFFSFTFKPNILQSFISSQLTTRFCHDSQKTSMPSTFRLTAERAGRLRHRDLGRIVISITSTKCDKLRFFNPFWRAKQLSFSIRHVSGQTSPFRLHMDLNFAIMDPFSII